MKDNQKAQKNNETLQKEPQIAQTEKAYENSYVTNNGKTNVTESGYVDVKNNNGIITTTTYNETKKTTTTSEPVKTYTSTTYTTGNQNNTP